jgi:hypothetical protein
MDPCRACRDRPPEMTFSRRPQASRPSFNKTITLKNGAAAIPFQFATDRAGPIFQVYNARFR